MTQYTADQISAMSSAIDQASQAGATPAQIMTALNAYYSAQTSVRGYATLALEVINDTGRGVLANLEVANAVGQVPAMWSLPNYGPTATAAC